VTDEAKQTLGAGGVATLLLWLFAMFGVLVLMAAPFDAPHQREGGVAAAMIAFALLVASGAASVVALISASVHWSRHRNALLVQVMVGSLFGALLLGGGLRLRDAWESEGHLPPLHAACIDGNVEQVRGLLEHGADANERDSAGETPTLHAARSGSRPILELLREHGASMTNVRIASAAASSGDLDALTYVLDQGASVDGILDERPIAAAVCGGHAPLVRLLIARGASIETGEWSAFETAAICEHPELFALLPASQAARDRALIEVIDAERSAVLVPVLAAGADPNHCDEGSCPVSLAVYRGALDTLRLLTRHGAHLNGALGAEALWPLEIAVGEGDRDTVVLLLTLGANLPHRDLTEDVASRGADAIADELLAPEAD